MAKLKTIRTDAEKQTSGAWIEYEGTGIQLLIARIDNPEYQKFVRERVRPRAGRRTRRVSDDEMEVVIKEAVAKTVLLGWKDLEDDDGKPLAYSSEKALELFNDPTLRDFYQFVLLTANDSELFRLEATEDIAQD